jgi:hypothetical protein
MHPQLTHLVLLILFGVTQLMISHQFSISKPPHRVQSMASPPVSSVTQLEDPITSRMLLRGSHASLYWK